jgi:hypothetical protein
MADGRPPGYRFYPTEEELICFYLRNKLDGRRVDDIERVIPVVDVYSVDPLQLSGTTLSTIDAIIVCFMRTVRCVMLPFLHTSIRVRRDPRQAVRRRGGAVVLLQ